MILGSSPAGAKVYRLRPASKLNSYGDPVDDWDAPVRKLLRGAEVQQTSAAGAADKESVTATADEIENVRNLFVPGRVDLTAYDRVESEGEVWRVEATPLVRAGLASAVYTIAKLRRFEGRKGA